VTTSPPGVGKVTVQHCKPGQFVCHHSKECIPVSLLCDGQPNCKDYSDEISCGTAPTRGLPGLHDQTSYTRRPGIHGKNTTGSPGLLTTRSEDDVPDVAPTGVTASSQPQST
ncbi:hypothetical protein ATANTOWER_026118, partial [Ataeniobius toweri]|nr:hypothetical protein [Ataeniobius toweri]